MKRGNYEDLSDCEKYMYTFLDADDAASKLDCMLFRSQFRTRFDHLMHGINVISTACDEVRSSVKLRMLMAVILTVVNQINTGGDGHMAKGFTLEGLLKLNEVSYT